MCRYVCSSQLKKTWSQAEMILCEETDTKHRGQNFSFQAFNMSLKNVFVSLRFYY